MGRKKREPLTKMEEDLLRAMGKVLTWLRKDIAGFSSSKSFAKKIHMDPALYGRYEVGENITTISLDRLLGHHAMKLDEFYQNVYKTLESRETDN